MTQFKSIFFILIFFVFLKVEAKNYDGKSYVCADELGPLLEFSIPNFGDNLFEKKVSLKLYNKIKLKDCIKLPFFLNFTQNF